VSRYRSATKLQALPPPSRSVYVSIRLLCYLLIFYVELRNKIYTHVFQAGKKSNLHFLRTCRLVYLEAGELAFSHLVFNSLSTTHNGRSFSKLSERQRRLICNIHLETEGPNLHALPDACHAEGVFPVHAMQIWRHTSPWEVTGGTRHNPLHEMLRLIFQCTYEGTPLALNANHAVFDQFLNNPRLEKWTLRLIYCAFSTRSLDSKYIDLVATRVQGDDCGGGLEGEERDDEEFRALPLVQEDWYGSSVGRKLGLEITFVDGGGDDEFVVEIKGVDEDGTVVDGSARVSFKVVQH
jgi:hypothetical protein